MARILLAALVALLLGAPARAAGLLDAPLSFSATRSVTLDGKTYTGAMFHEPGHERHEQKLGGMDTVFLLDGPAGEGFLVVPMVKTYVSFFFPPLLSALVDGEVEKHPVGQAIVDHIATTEYRIEKTTADGTHGEGFAWVSKRGVLMKLVGLVTAPGGHKTSIAMQLANFKAAPQPAALFVLPAHLTELPFQALAPLLGGVMSGPILPGTAR